MTDPLKRYSEELRKGSFPDLPERATPFLFQAINARVSGLAMQPGEGKAPFFTKPQAIEPVRGIASVEAENGNAVYHGTLSNLYYWAATATGAVETRTATSIGTASATAYSGQVNTTATGEATVWSMAQWGSYLIASNGKDPIQYDTGSGFADLKTATGGDLEFSTAEIIVTRDPFLVAMNTTATAGTIDGKKTVRWSDRDDFQEWTATSLANFAGARSIRDVDGEIVAAINYLGEIAFFARNSMHLLAFIGAPRVFSNRRVFKGIGCLSKQAVAILNGVLYGMGPAGIWRATLEGYQYIDTAIVHDLVYKNINLGQAAKIVVSPNKEHKTVAFHYPSAQSLDNDKFVLYNTVDPSWSEGSGNVSARDGTEAFALSLIGTKVGDILKDAPVGSLSQSSDAGVLTYTAAGELVSGFGELGFGELGFGGVTPLDG